MTDRSGVREPDILADLSVLARSKSTYWQRVGLEAITEIKRLREALTVMEKDRNALLEGRLDA